jgi:Protein of unknown function (DUF2478)
MADQAKITIRRGVDVVIVNRFGPLEAAGRGFSEAIAVASDTKTPLVIAVTEFEFERWTRFSSGMTVKLECDLDPGPRLVAQSFNLRPSHARIQRPRLRAAQVTRFCISTLLLRPSG